MGRHMVSATADYGGYETSLEDIPMPVVEAPSPTGGMKRTQFQLNGRDKIVGVRHRSLNR